MYVNDHGMSKRKFNGHEKSPKPSLEYAILEIYRNFSFVRQYGEMTKKTSESARSLTNGRIIGNKNIFLLT